MPMKQLTITLRSINLPVTQKQLNDAFKGILILVALGIEWWIFVPVVEDAMPHSFDYTSEILLGINVMFAITMIYQTFDVMTNINIIRLKKGELVSKVKSIEN